MEVCYVFYLKLYTLIKMGLQPNYFESSCINIAFLDFEQTQADKPYHLDNIYCIKYKDLCRFLLNFTRKNKAFEVDS